MPLVVPSWRVWQALQTWAWAWVGGLPDHRSWAREVVGSQVRRPRWTLNLRRTGPRLCLRDLFAGQVWSLTHLHSPNLSHIKKCPGTRTGFFYSTTFTWPLRRGEIVPKLQVFPWDFWTFPLYQRNIFTDNAPSSGKFRRQGFFHYWERSELNTKNFKARLYFLLLVFSKYEVNINCWWWLLLK